MSFHPLPPPRRLTAAVLLLGLGACDPSAGTRQTDLATARLDPGAAPVRRTVLPQETDPAITLALDAHVVRAPAGKSNGRLFLYLPSSRSVPAISELVQDEAARLGYHVVGLAYPNNPGLASYCPPSGQAQACYEDTRLEVITGEDRSAFVAVDHANSIDHRVERVLAFLDEHWPEEGWDRFVGANGPRWQHVVVGGHSQGAGHAAMIAKLRLVRRVVMLSGVTDGSVFGGGVTSGPAEWVTIGATPPERYYGLAHLRDNAFRQSILANWAQLGLDGFGAPVAPESSQPPYAGTHEFVTDLLPSTGSYTAPAPHGSTGVDIFTPLVAGLPVLRDVWRYLLGWCPGNGVGAGANTVVPCEADESDPSD